MSPEPPRKGGSCFGATAQACQGDDLTIPDRPARNRHACVNPQDDHRYIRLCASAEGPVGPNPCDGLWVVRLDPARMAVIADEGVGHPFRFVPGQRMDLFA